LNPVKDELVVVDPTVEKDVFYASVYRHKNTIRTTTSRAIALVTKGENLQIAKERNNSKLQKINGNLFFRNDIGSLL
jgi:phosphoribosylamine-glycine ligase